MTKVAKIEAHRPSKSMSARGEPELSLVPPASAGERARRLFNEARSISVEHLAALQEAIDETRGLALEVVDAGDLYGAGLQDFARRLAEELFWRGKSLQALAERQRVAAFG